MDSSISPAKPTESNGPFLASPEPPPNIAKDPSLERDLITVTSLGHFICHLGEGMYGGVLVAWVTQFELDRFWSAVLPMVGIVLLGAGAIPVSLWADAWGPTRVFRIYFFAMCAAALLVALSPNVLVLFIALTLLGMAASIYHPVGLALLAMGTTRRGVAMGINGVVGNFGIALGPAIGFYMTQMGFWRGAYLIVAACSLISAGFFWWVTRKLTHGHPPGSDPLARHRHQSNAASSPIANPPQSWRRHVPLVLLLGVMMLGGLNYRCLMTALPTYLGGEGSGQNSEELKSLLIFVSLIIGGFGQYFGGWLSDRFGARYVYPAIIAMLIPLGLALSFLEGSAFAFVVVSLLAVFLFGQQPIENSVLAEGSTGGRQSLSYGAKFILTFSFGALGGTVVGWIWDNFHGMGPVFFFIACSAAVMTVGASVALGLRERQTKQRQAVAANAVGTEEALASEGITASIHQITSMGPKERQ
jgi:FSR family fosmidomycin resistance protein-like MFS transporter